MIKALWVKFAAHLNNRLRWSDRVLEPFGRPIWPPLIFTEVYCVGRAVF